MHCGYGWAVEIFVGTRVQIVEGLRRAELLHKRREPPPAAGQKLPFGAGEK